MQKKPIDLGVPPPTRHTQIIPSFRRQNRLVSSQAVTSAVTLFNPDAACTVQWVVVQTSAACILQMTLNGQPFGAALNLPAGTIGVYAGTLLANNEQIGFTVSAATTLSWELVWVKDFFPESVLRETSMYQPTPGASGVSNINLAQWNGVAVSSPETSAPSGSESAPVVRVIFRKGTTIETTTPLAANGVFTGAWHDTDGDGSMQVIATLFTNVISASNGFIIQESDDITNANFTRLVIGYGGATVASTLTRIIGLVKARYWRVQYTNGVTLQTSMELTTTAFNMLTPTYERNFTNLLSTPYAEQVSAVVAQGPNAIVDGAVNNSNNIVNYNNTAVPLQVLDTAFNGATWDRRRNNQNTTTGDAGAKTASFNGATQTNFEGLGALITILLGTVSGTIPTLIAQLQWSPDGAGTTWLNLGAAIAALTATGQTGLIGIFPTNFSQAVGATPVNLTSGATVQSLMNSILPRTWRLAYTIGGTTPSFAITAVYVNYMKA